MPSIIDKLPTHVDGPYYQPLIYIRNCHSVERAEYLTPQHLDRATGVLRTTAGDVYTFIHICKGRGFRLHYTYLAHCASYDDYSRVVEEYRTTQGFSEFKYLTSNIGSISIA
jgi:hypothetical protein